MFLVIQIAILNCFIKQDLSSLYPYIDTIYKLFISVGFDLRSESDWFDYNNNTIRWTICQRNICRSYVRCRRPKTYFLFVSSHNCIIQHSRAIFTMLGSIRGCKVCDRYVVYYQFLNIVSFTVFLTCIQLHYEHVFDNIILDLTTIDIAAYTLDYVAGRDHSMRS